MKILPQIYKCPKCHSLLNGILYLSGNNLDSTLYSDSYLDAPMGIPFMSSYIGCPSCENVFNKKEVERIRESKYFSDPTIQKPLSDFYTLKILLEDQRYNDKSNRKNFTLNYLHMFNHTIDREMKKEEIKKGNYKKYTDELLQFLELDTEDSGILKAEILRERKEFDKAEEIIKIIEKSDTIDERRKKILREMKDRIAKKDPDVFVIK